MVNFGPYDTVPEQFKNRNLYKHNPTVTLMRTSKDENVQIGQAIADKLNIATNKTSLFIPLKGVSAIDAEGQPFYGPEEDNILFETLKDKVNRDKIEVIEMNNNINDKEFAEAAAQKLIDYMENIKI